MATVIVERLQRLVVDSVRHFQFKDSGNESTLSLSLSLSLSTFPLALDTHTLQLIATST